MEYPKTETLYKREFVPGYTKPRGLLIGEFSRPEFGLINQWRVEEKIDGMNIRVYISPGNITIQGRGKDSQLPPKLITYFHENQRLQANQIDYNLQLFGEGFGAGIQKGGVYRPDMAFILFDVLIDGKWGTRADVKVTAELFDFDTPHDYGMMTTEQIVDFVKSKPLGRYRDTLPNHKPYPSEGIIARSEPLLFNMHNERCMFKLKVKDF